MKKVEIKGIIPPIITPMNEDESVKDVYKRQALHQRQRAGEDHTELHERGRRAEPGTENQRHLPQVRQGDSGK